MNKIQKTLAGIVATAYLAGCSGQGNANESTPPIDEHQTELTLRCYNFEQDLNRQGAYITMTKYQGITGMLVLPTRRPTVPDLVDFMQSAPDIENSPHLVLMVSPTQFPPQAYQEINNSILIHFEDASNSGINLFDCPYNFLPLERMR